MKFFYKMFLGMTVILAVALGMIECVTLSYSLEHAVKREQENLRSSDAFADWRKNLRDRRS